MTPREVIDEFRREIAKRAKERHGEMLTIAVPLPIAIKIVQAFDEVDLAAEHLADMNNQF